MSTQIKKNGNWVTVAGGTRMWVGTKAALQAALDAGELVDGTAVMVTDDYDEAVDFSSLITNNAGFTLDTKYAKKVGKVCMLSLHWGANAPTGAIPGGTVLATLPEGYRPSGTVFAHGSCWGTTMTYPMQFVVQSNGKVIVGNDVSSDRTDIYMNEVTYIAEE